MRTGREIGRTLTVHLVHPLVRLLCSRRSGHIPILTYREVKSLGTKAEENLKASTPAETFACQMKYLRECGYVGVDLQEGLQAMLLGGDGRKLVILTFDDGYRSLYTEGFPALAKYGFRGTAFLVSGCISDCRVNHNGHEYLTWREVRELRANGIRIGSRTVTHSDLAEMKEEEVEFEVGFSKETIEDRLGESISSFSYPFAGPGRDLRFKAWFRSVLEAYGYVCGVTASVGTANPKDDWYFLPRMPVNLHDDLTFFRAKLEGGYDWFHFAEGLYNRRKVSGSVSMTGIPRRV